MNDPSAPLSAPDSTLIEERKAMMATLAAADAALLGDACRAIEPLPAYETLRAPETGLMMVRGRIGRTGGPFNLGEVTVTRCVIRLENGVSGHAYIMGRNKKKALQAALVDALWQLPAEREKVETLVVTPLAARQRAEDARMRSETAATKVDFFTMVRGDD